MGLIGVILYSISVVIYRSQRHGIRPLIISAIKMWIALPVIALLAVLFGETPLLMIPLGTVLVLGASVIVNAVIGDTLYIISQERIGVSYAFPISLSSPIFTFALAVWLLNEPFILSRLIGTVLAIVGVLLLSNEQEKMQETEDTKKFDSLGVGLAILTSFLWAIGSIVLQVGMTDIDIFSGNLVRMLVGSVSFVPLVSVAFKRGCV